MRKSIIFIIIGLSLAAIAAIGYFGFFHKQAMPAVQTSKTVDTAASTPAVQNGATLTAGETSGDLPDAIAYLTIEPPAAAKVFRGSAFTPARDGMILLGGDRINVTFGSVTLVYPDSGVSKLDQGTEATIMPDGDVRPGTGIGALIILKAGSIWTRFERLLDIGETFSVESSGVVATVRGTAFGVQNIDGDLDIKVTDHAVRVATLDDWMAAKQNPQLALTTGVELGEGQKMQFNQTQLLALAGKPFDFETGRPMAAPPPDPDYLMKMSIQEMSDEELMDAEDAMTEEDLDEYLQMPDEPWNWEALPELTPEMQMYLDPQTLRAWQQYQQWYLENEAQILEAQRLMQQMQAGGYVNPEDVPTFTPYPTMDPSATGAQVYYDENGNPVYTEPPPEPVDDPSETDPNAPSYDGIELLGVPYDETMN